MTEFILKLNNWTLNHRKSWCHHLLCIFMGDCWAIWRSKS